MVGRRAKQVVLIEEEEEKGCGPTSPGFGTLMVMSQARPGRRSRFPCGTAPNR